MTDTTTYPLSTAYAAAQHSDATNASELCAHIIQALIRKGAVAATLYLTTYDVALAAFRVTIDAAIDTQGHLDMQARNLAAEMGVNALRSHGLLLDSTT